MHALVAKGFQKEGKIRKAILTARAGLKLEYKIDKELRAKLYVGWFNNGAAGIMREAQSSPLCSDTNRNTSYTGHNGLRKHTRHLRTHAHMTRAYTQARKLACIHTHTHAHRYGLLATCLVQEVNDAQEVDDEDGKPSTGFLRESKIIESPDRKEESSWKMEKEEKQATNPVARFSAPSFLKFGGEEGGSPSREEGESPSRVKKWRKKKSAKSPSEM